MMKKLFLSAALLSVLMVLAGCGGTDSGSSSEPAGVSPKVPSVIQLLPVQYVAQTNSQLVFFAKVLDGNGNPVKDVPVTFTNISPIGSLTPPLSAASSVRVVKTNGIGMASIGLWSTVDGFATIQAEVNNGSGQVRDSRTVYFTSSSTWPLPDFPPIPGGQQAVPVLSLSVDGDADKEFDEPDDFIVLQDPEDNIVEVRATVEESFGGSRSAVEGVIVDFFTDLPSEVSFLLGKDSDITNADGEASVFIQIAPDALRNVQTKFNILASADNGAFNIVTLFIEPVTITDISVTANPTRIDVGGQSKITALVTTSAGTPVPDGTTVNFSVNEGAIVPYGQTSDGIAESQYSASDIPGGKTITATAGGVSGSVQIFVLAPPVEPPDPENLVILPAVVSVYQGDIVQFQVKGGIPPYSITSEDLSRACHDVGGTAGACDPGIDTGIWTTATFAVTIDPVADTGDVAINVIDSDGKTVSASITIIEGGGGAPGPGPGGGVLNISLSPTIVVGKENVEFDFSDDVMVTVSGGFSPYIVSSDNPALTPDGPWAFSATPFSFTIDPNNVGAETSVVLTVVDNLNTKADATLTIFPQTSGLVISVDKPDVIGLHSGGSCSLTASQSCHEDSECPSTGACEISLALCDDDSECVLNACSVTTSTACNVDGDCPLGESCIAGGEICVTVDETCLPGPGDGDATDDITFTVTGGTAPYIISDGANASALFDQPGTDVSDDGPWQLSNSGDTYTIDPEETPGATTIFVILTVTDNNGAIATTTFNIHP
jgi:hypothetical protein